MNEDAILKRKLVQFIEDELASYKGIDYTTEFGQGYYGGRSALVYTLVLKFLTAEEQERLLDKLDSL